MTTANYAKLPQAPRNASPVPHLTSLYHFDKPGEFGDRKYPGNCGGELIKDLLTYFKPNSVFDPMTGSGTCRDVCERTGHLLPFRATCTKEPTPAMRRNSRVNALSSPGFTRPTGGMKLYTDDARDLSRTPTLQALRRTLPAVDRKLCRFAGEGRQARRAHGRLHRPRSRICAAGVLHQVPCHEIRPPATCTDIIRFSATVPAAGRRLPVAASSPACMTYA